MKKNESGLVATFVVGISILNTIPLMAASDAATVTNKVNQGLTIIRGVLTGIIVVVGVIAALKIVISKLPSLDDPHVKNEMWRSVSAISVYIFNCSIIAAI